MEEDPTVRGLKKGTISQFPKIYRRLKKWQWDRTNDQRSGKFWTYAGVCGQRGR